MKSQENKLVLTDEFINSLPEENDIALLMIVEPIMQQLSGKNRLKIHQMSDDLIELYAFFVAFCKSRGLKFPYPKLDLDPSGNSELIKGFFDQIFPNIKTEYLKISYQQKYIELQDKYSIKFKSVFSYEFTTTDFNRVQTAINNLRDLIVSSKLFDENHRERLLKKVELLQNELHKKVSNLDKFWGLMGDAGVALGKFGEDAKPFVDLIKEITNIVWRTIANAENVDVKALPPIIKKDDFLDS